jgi:hypothetical protein
MPPSSTVAESKWQPEAQPWPRLSLCRKFSQQQSLVPSAWERCSTPFNSQSETLKWVTQHTHKPAPLDLLVLTSEVHKDSRKVKMTISSCFPYKYVVHNFPKKERAPPSLFQSEVFIECWVPEEVQRETMMRNSDNLFGSHRSLLGSLLVNKHFSFFFFFRWEWVWTQSFSLAKWTLYHFCHISSTFCSGYFRDGILWTICPG